MLRLFILTSFLLLNLYACEGGYFSCIAKIKDSQTIEDNTLYIPVKNDKLLVYSQYKPKAKILKYDPFSLNMRLQLGSAIVNDKVSKEGKILKNQIGLNSLGVYSTRFVKAALITSSCCSLEGIYTTRGVIQKEFIAYGLLKGDQPLQVNSVEVKNQNELLQYIENFKDFSSLLFSRRNFHFFVDIK